MMLHQNYIFMNHITLVTGNQNKLRELKEIAPAELEFSSKDIDLPEIQSLDIHKIAEDKVKRAYALLSTPVIVEDVSLGFDDLGGLPGPFYKFFREKLGDEVLLKLSTLAKNNKVTIQCIAAYYDGKNLLYGQGTINGEVVEHRGKNGFGFDPFIVPNGYKITMAQMQPEQKHKISHRGQAFRNLIVELDKIDV
jgi:non-canonical purine NTP pyrophosphatase (RdgB/HAM1 family)